jgi:uncharacterized protein YlxW (UPF0749 family)
VTRLWPPQDSLGRVSPDVLTELFREPLDPGYADAARRRAERGVPAARPGRTDLALRCVALLAIGFLFAVGYRHAVAAEPERSRAHAGLVNEIKQAQARTDALGQRANALRQQVNRLQESALGGERLRALRDQEAATGLAAVRGAGVLVTLTDSPPSVDPNTGKNADGDAGRVLDVDLQDVVNELWAQGAEAIAVNGERLTSISTIRAAGQAILVDFTPVTSPYRVAAIGPADLLDRFTRSIGATALKALAAEVGFDFDAVSRIGLILPGASEVPLNYATPLGLASPAPSRSAPRRSASPSGGT